MSDLVRNLEDRFSHVAAHFLKGALWEVLEMTVGFVTKHYKNMPNLPMQYTEIFSSCKNYLLKTSIVGTR